MQKKGRGQDSIVIIKNQFPGAMLCIAKTALCSPFRPGAVQLHKLVAEVKVPL